MVVDGRVDQGIILIWNMIRSFFNFPFPGTNIKIGLIGVTCFSMYFIIRIVLMKWLLGVDHD